MRKIHLGCIFVATLFVGSGLLAEEVDMAKEVANMQQVSFVMANYGPGRATRKEMRSAEKKVESTWADFVEIQGANHPLAKPLSLIRARTLTAAKRTKKIVPAWQGALRRLPAKTTPGRRVNLYIEAANAAASVGKFQEAQSFYAVARSLEVQSLSSTLGSMNLKVLAHVCGGGLCEMHCLTSVNHQSTLFYGHRLALMLCLVKLKFEWRISPIVLISVRTLVNSKPNWCWRKKA